VSWWFRKVFTPLSGLCRPFITGAFVIRGGRAHVGMMRFSSILLFAASFAASTVDAQPRFARATTIGTVDSIWSPTLKEQRPYLVYTPPSYSDTTISPARYPVLYLLDGDAHFHSVSGLVQILATGVNGTYAIPELIVIAIPNTNRLRDLSPTRPTVGLDGKPWPNPEGTGGMPAFLSFIQKELIPHVDSTYRTHPYRVFVGHSLGGITTIDALYTMPNVFNAYVAIDPSLWWDSSTLLKQAKERITNQSFNTRVLYVAQANTLNPDEVATNGHFSGITQFNALMQTYGAQGLRYDFKYYEKEDHGSVPLIAEYDALRFIFDGYKVNVQRVMQSPRSIMQHYQDVSAKLGAPFAPTESSLRLYGAIAQDSTVMTTFAELATELYPRSYQAWNRLGALFMARGDKGKARAAFEGSLRAGPDNSVAKEQLIKLGG
jgi:predicted alpha/beta superfamily hydrolase